jgi:hypothetical protein
LREWRQSYGIDKAFKTQQNDTMPSKLDAYRPQITQLRLHGLPWRAIAEKLAAESGVKVTNDELLRYMRRANNKAAKILAELASLHALEAKKRASLSGPPAVGGASQAVGNVGEKRPTVEEIKKQVAAEMAGRKQASSKWDRLEPDFRKPQL